jgi:hypothetical protein
MIRLLFSFLFNDVTMSQRPQPLQFYCACLHFLHLIYLTKVTWSRHVAWQILVKLCPQLRQSRLCSFHSKIASLQQGSGEGLVPIIILPRASGNVWHHAPPSTTRVINL